LAWMRKMSRIQNSAHRTLASIYACLGDERKAKEALVVFLKDSPGDSLSKVREQWGKSRIGSEAVARLIKHLRLAGLPE
jgi:adenylate cyclase